MIAATLHDMPRAARHGPPPTPRYIAIAALVQLRHEGRVDARVVAQAITDLGVDPEKVDPVFA